MRKAPAVREEDVAEALSSSAYRMILAACIREARPVKKISRITDLPLASVYRQVKALTDRGILVVERSAMTADGKPYDLYRSRLREAALRVTAGGVEVTWTVDEALEDRLMHMWHYLGGDA